VSILTFSRLAKVLLVLGAVACAAGALADGPADTSAPTTSKPRNLLDQVIVTARRQIDQHTLENLVIPKFVDSHGKANERGNQIARWHTGLCPMTLGLQPAYNEFVTRRIVELAKSVGAPTLKTRHCQTNVEVLFSENVQQQIDYVLKREPVLLGYANAGAKSLARIDHPIQAWYVTGTQSSVFRTTPTNAPAGSSDPGSAVTPSSVGGTPSFGGSAVNIDSQFSLVGAEAGSRLGSHMTSQFVNVLVLADSSQVKQYSLSAVADYVAMLVLTRAALDGCNPLPSVIDLLSSECADRDPPKTITDADTAFLQALYSSRLDMKLSVERGELHDKMLSGIDTDHTAPAGH